MNNAGNCILLEKNDRTVRIKIAKELSIFMIKIIEKLIRPLEKKNLNNELKLNFFILIIFVVHNNKIYKDICTMFANMYMRRISHRIYRILFQITFFYNFAYLHSPLYLYGVFGNLRATLGAV